MSVGKPERVTQKDIEELCDGPEILDHLVEFRGFKEGDKLPSGVIKDILCHDGTGEVFFIVEDNSGQLWWIPTDEYH